MSRKPNPDKLNRADYITRTKETHTYNVSYVPEGQKIVEDKEITVSGSETIARRNAMKQAKAYGKVIACEHINTQKKLVGMKLEKFYSEAEELEFETESESEDN
jgi:hypothetical protein